jgi:hypothetical protein
VTFSIEDSDDRERVYVRAVDAQEISSRALDATEEAVITYLRAVGSAGTADIKNAISGDNNRKVSALQNLVRNGEVICDEGPRGSKTYYLKPKPTPEGMF